MQNEMNCCTPNKMPIIGHMPQNIEFDVFYKNKMEKKRISNFRGKWLILFFYPADFTFVCPTELEEMADNYAKLQELGAEVVSVSTDTAFVHKAWHDSSPAIKKIEFPMGADPTGILCKEFGVYIPHEGLALRGTFVMDETGKLSFFEVNNNDIGRSAVELIRKLEAAIYVKEHDGMVCPASWKPGKNVLKPGLDLVGKI
jgi:peroxiredoxin (alkyl hydroperoxide reductase subunit C)